jgi:hypothetical protein
MSRNLAIPAVSAAVLLCATCAGWSAGDERFQGGAYDGYGSARFLQEELPTMSARFTGGAYDGYSSARFLQEESPTMSARFAGGGFDGYGSANFLQEKALTLRVRFFGGGYDGYGSARFLQEEAALTMSARFFGGSYDGSDHSAAAGLANPLDRDSDGDGLPDWWELPYFDGITNASSSGDADGDRTTEFTEYVADTNPRNSNSVFKVVALSNTTGRAVHFNSSSNRNYTLESCDGLATGGWAAVGGQSNRAGPGGPFSLTDSNAASRRVYRVGARLP